MVPVYLLQQRMDHPGLFFIDRDLAVDLTLRMADSGVRRPSPRQALVSRNRRAACREAGMGRAESRAAYADAVMRSRCGSASCAWQDAFSASLRNVQN